MITIGTEKQIASATAIRADKLSKWGTLIAELNSVDRARNQMLADVLSKIVSTVSECADAEVWIDGRDSVAVMLHCIGQKDAALFGTDAREFRNILNMMN